MNTDTPIILIGIGTAGSAMARNVNRAFGQNLRHLLVDTDVVSGQHDDPFLLLGGDRLSGRGTGGDVVSGRLAAEDSVRKIDEHLEGVRLAVIVTALGGGTGSGATLETVRYLTEKGISSIVFATLPFSFEGEDRQRNARGIISMIEDCANSVCTLPLDKLIGDTDNMDDAMQRAIDTMAVGITLFWRLVQKPGYIRLDVERLRHIIVNAGRSRFATVTVQGPDRAREAVDQLVRSETLASSTGSVGTILCGILAGEDLRLSELSTISSGIRAAFGEQRHFELATVNDEATFCGRMSVVIMLFESDANKDGNEESSPAPRSSLMSNRKKPPRKGSPDTNAVKGRFKNSEPTIWNGENLDVPTFIRKSLSLDV